jgi:undecaprenyl-diphosphatase
LSRLGNGWIYPVIAAACLVVAGSQTLLVILIAAVNVALLHCVYRPIKLWSRRPRPYQSYPELNPLLAALDEHSFSSGHAMTLTAVLVPLALAFPLLLIPAAALWLFMAWARLASAHHYGSDILAGAGLALGVAYPISIWTLERFATVPWVRAFPKGEAGAVKHAAMVADAIKDVSKRNGIVLDAFGGSGSTLIAAHKTGWRARLIELDPVYVERIIRRWQAYANDDAILAETGERFDKVSRERRESKGGLAHG